ncbi:Ubiquitin-like modifier-activating enzyme ATG7 [Halotydeus destructor]|nr:Ubiquitin-like modifier-activating enzyme ATG7 [Halotydeus destructor]
MTSPNNLKFFPFSSVIDPSFWHILSEKKLNDLKLSEGPLSIKATYRIENKAGTVPLLTVDYDSFESSSVSGSALCSQSGEVIVTNTIDDFKNRDKQSLIDDHGAKIWESINSAEETDINELNRFVILTYLDLKKFIFYYWFAFPALVHPKVQEETPAAYLKDIISDTVRRTLEGQLAELPTKLRSGFICTINGDTLALSSLHEFAERRDLEGKSYLCFYDPSAHSQYPGWPLRNLLAYVSIKFPQVTSWSVICIRTIARSCDFSLVLNLSLDPAQVQSMPKAVGWEKNQRGQLLPRSVDMSAILDPQKLAKNAVNLNLKLMRWRLVPELDLEKIASTKCLLLGSGTLGCNVARALIGWGVEQITFVDNSKVSYSNPVRQSLFTFADCLNGGQPKAQAAADSLKCIYPNVSSRAVELSIPMPGHFVSENLESATEQTVAQLDCLIREHDCVFLLMDTRESRWLPTVITQAHKKLCINAALGFDSFLVQRHGVRTEGEQSEAPTSNMDAKLLGRHLGCYFCNDVVAPGNSTRDRTLDQQCTVTRPGISMMAGAMAAELMVSVVQHPLGPDAPTFTNEDDNEPEMCLGIVPHQIRGFLSRFQNILPSTAAFKYCTACSPLVISAYANEGFPFLLRAFNDPGFLEEMTGLKKLHEDINVDDVWALSDDEDKFSLSSQTSSAQEA